MSTILLLLVVLVISNSVENSNFGGEAKDFCLELKIFLYIPMCA